MIKFMEQGPENLPEESESVSETLKQNPFWGKGVTKVPSLDEFVAEQKIHLNPEEVERWDRPAQVQTYAFFLEQLNEEKKRREKLYSDYVAITLGQMKAETRMTFEEFEAKNYGIKKE